MPYFLDCARNSGQDQYPLSRNGEKLWPSALGSNSAPWEFYMHHTPRMRPASRVITQVIASSLPFEEEKDSFNFELEHLDWEEYLRRAHIGPWPVEALFENSS